MHCLPNRKIILFNEAQPLNLWLVNANRSQVEYHEIICYKCVNYHSNPNYMLSMRQLPFDPKLYVIHASTTSPPQIIYYPCIHISITSYPIINHKLFFLLLTFSWSYSMNCWLSIHQIQVILELSIIYPVIK